LDSSVRRVCQNSCDDYESDGGHAC
jgi:hypothetical protein